MRRADAEGVEAEESQIPLPLVGRWNKNGFVMFEKPIDIFTIYREKKCIQIYKNSTFINDVPCTYINY
jgi:hypothetical protein